MNNSQSPPLLLDTPASIYSRAAWLAADPRIAGSLESMRQLCIGWQENISPIAVHRVLSEHLPVPEGRVQHQAMYLQLVKVDTSPQPLTVNHARLWQFMSLRFMPRSPQGLLQFQMELSVILEQLAREQVSVKPLLQLT